MIKNIVINDKTYQLPLEDVIVGKTSGNCYHLKDENVDWAVKLYHEEREENLYPALGELERICMVKKEVFPVLVSEYPVFDTEENYIGCCSPFIYEKKGPTIDVLYEEPLDFLLKELQRVKKTLPIFNRRKIRVFDWSISNLKMGELQNAPYGMYLFDDSFYQIISKEEEREENLEQLNQEEFKHLIISLMDRYYTTKKKKNELPSLKERQKRLAFLTQFRKEDGLSLLEEKTKGCKTLGKYLDQVKERGYR